jgi:hypothetical protein
MEDTRAGDVEFLEITSVEMGDPASQIGSVITFLRDDTDRIVANWVIRVANMPAFRAWPELGLDKLKDTIPDLIDAMLTIVSVDDPEALARVVEIAAEHGRERARNGFPIGAVLAEYQALREELHTVLHRIADEDLAWQEGSRELERRVNHVIDAALIDAAEAWVDEALNQAQPA